jgi:hypothetical protein
MLRTRSLAYGRPVPLELNHDRPPFFWAQPERDGPAGRHRAAKVGRFAGAERGRRAGRPDPAADPVKAPLERSAGRLQSRGIAGFAARRVWAARRIGALTAPKPR